MAVEGMDRSGVVQREAVRGSSELLEAQHDRIRRVGRIMTGSRDGSQQLLQRLDETLRYADPEQLEGPCAEILLWQVSSRLLLKELPPMQGVLQRPSEQDSPSARLGHALAALPVRKRLAIVLAHHERFDIEKLALALEVSTQEADILLSAAEGHLQAILRAWGDTLSFTPKGTRH